MVKTSNKTSKDRDQRSGCPIFDARAYGKTKFILIFDDNRFKYKGQGPDLWSLIFGQFFQRPGCPNLSPARVRARGGA